MVRIIWDAGECTHLHTKTIFFLYICSHCWTMLLWDLAKNRTLSRKWIEAGQRFCPLWLEKIAPFLALECNHLPIYTIRFLFRSKNYHSAIKFIRNLSQFFSFVLLLNTPHHKIYASTWLHFRECGVTWSDEQGLFSVSTTQQDYI